MRATTCWTPKVSRATRALMMLELSPLLTAANAPAESIPASSSVCRSKPRPVTWRPAASGHRAAGEGGPEPAEGFGVLVDHRDAVPDLFQPPGDGGAHPAAAHHDHVHDKLPQDSWCRAPSARAVTGREATPGRRRGPAPTARVPSSGGGRRAAAAPGVA